MAEQKRDYYEVMGVQKGATDEEIKKACDIAQASEFINSQIDKYETQRIII